MFMYKLMNIDVNFVCVCVWGGGGGSRVFGSLLVDQSHA